MRTRGGRRAKRELWKFVYFMGNEQRRRGVCRNAATTRPFVSSRYKIGCVTRNHECTKRRHARVFPALSYTQPATELPIGAKSQLQSQCNLHFLLYISSPSLPQIGASTLANPASSINLRSMTNQHAENAAHLAILHSIIAPTHFDISKTTSTWQLPIHQYAIIIGPTQRRTLKRFVPPGGFQRTATLIAVKFNLKKFNFHGNPFASSRAGDIVPYCIYTVSRISVLPSSFGFRPNATLPQWLIVRHLN